MTRPLSKNIRQVSFALSAVLLAGSAQAEWIPLGRSNNFRAYLDSTSIQRNGDLAQIWQLMDFTTARWMDEKTVIWSLKNLIEYDCRQPRFRTLAAEAYSEQMGDGRVMAKEQVPDPQWENFEPNGSAEKIRQIACEKH